MGGEQHKDDAGEAEKYGSCSGSKGRSWEDSNTLFPHAGGGDVCQSYRVKWTCLYFPWRDSEMLIVLGKFCGESK